jgi:hypothetical protein
MTALSPQRLNGECPRISPYYSAINTNPKQSHVNEINLTIFLDESARLANAETKNAPADNDNVTETKCQHVYRSSLTSCGNAD